MSVAVGNNSAAGTSSVVVGFNGLAGADGNSVTNGDYTTAIGNEAWATEDGASVVGYNSYAQAVDSTVLGSNAWTTKEATNSVSLGAGSLADRANSVSMGAAQDWTDAAGVVHSAIDRQVTNVAAGTEATDAVNKGQLDEVADSIGDANDYLSVNGLGDGSDAALAVGDNASAVGANAIASGNESSAYGSQSDAEGGYAGGAGRQQPGPWRRLFCDRQWCQRTRRLQRRQRLRQRRDWPVLAGTGTVGAGHGRCVDRHRCGKASPAVPTALVSARAARQATTRRRWAR